MVGWQPHSCRVALLACALLLSLSGSLFAFVAGRRAIARINCEARHAERRGARGANCADATHDGQRAAVAPDHQRANALRSDTAGRASNATQLGDASLESWVAAMRAAKLAARTRAWVEPTGPDVLYPALADAHCTAAADVNANARARCAASASRADGEVLSAGARALLLANSSAIARQLDMRIALKLSPCLSRLSRMRAAASGPQLERAPRRTDARDGSRAAPSCAVVGSSDILRLHALVTAGALAARIDAHDIVLRVNHAPTAGYERVAGGKTTHRLVNHVLVARWARPAPVDRVPLVRGAAARERADEAPADLCAPRSGDVEVGCVYRDRGARALRLLDAYARTAAGARTVAAGAELGGLEDACAAAISRAPVSSGLVAVLLAAQSRCALPVDVYGFFPFCCHHAPFARMRYKYYAGEATRWVCCAHGREAMEEEYALLELLEAAGWLRLHAMPPRSALAPKCSAKPTAAELRGGGGAAGGARERFVAHEGVATEHADIACGELSLDHAPCVCRVCAAAAARTCRELAGACVGFEVSRDSPQLATLKGRATRLVAHARVTWHALPSRAQRAADDAYGRDGTRPPAEDLRDMPCPDGARSAIAPASGEAPGCVACPGSAASLCSRTAGCGGYSVDQDGRWATLKSVASGRAQPPLFAAPTDGSQEQSGATFFRRRTAPAVSG